METIENIDFNREDSIDHKNNEKQPDMLHNKDYLKKDNIFRQQYQQQPIQYNNYSNDTGVNYNQNYNSYD